MQRGGAAFDRFAHWPRKAAWAALAFIAIALVAAAWTAPKPPEARATSTAPQAGQAQGKGVRDRDIELYATIAKRVRAGENYYTVAVEEQRAGNYPVRPGVAVRLPTLAYLTAWLGTSGLLALGILLCLATLVAWWRRLSEEPGGYDRRFTGPLLLLVGTIVGLKTQYIIVHEVWAGLLLALGGGLHRPGRWQAAWLPVALALAIREHALPFVLLLAAMAVWRRDWREAAAWLVLVVLFALGLAWHLHEVSLHTLPNDPQSPPWLVFRGLGGLTGNIISSSLLYNLPNWLAGPLVLLPLVGWAGWKSPQGTFYTLLLVGYGVFFMAAGRANNFYWALVVTPPWFVGYTFLPMALRSLIASARSARA